MPIFTDLDTMLVVYVCEHCFTRIELYPDDPQYDTELALPKGWHHEPDGELFCGDCNEMYDRMSDDGNPHH